MKRPKPIPGEEGSFRLGLMFQAISFLLVLLVTMTLVRCNGGVVTPTPTLASQLPTGTATSVAIPADVQATLTPAVTQTQVIIIWLPPEMDPENGSQAAEILAARLQSFEDQNPGVLVNVRVKAEEGSSGLLNSLILSRAAAPDALPSIVALSLNDLASAANQGLIFPLDGISGEVGGEDWFVYAREMSQLDDRYYSLPFAGDLLMMGYHSTRFSGDPTTWAGVFARKLRIVFAANDPEAPLAMTLYYSAGGAMSDTKDFSALDLQPLSDALTIFQQGTRSGVFVSTALEISSDADVWAQFRESKNVAAIGWVSGLAGDLPADAVLQPVPSLTDTPYTLARGWAWCLSDPTPGRRQVSIQLAEYLSDPLFLADWSAALGYLPTRPDSLANWRDPQIRDMIETPLLTAHEVPSQIVLQTVGPVLRSGVSQVIQQQASPQDAAQAVLDRLGGSK